ncbi:hypothetical protein L2E82_11318 [Cichorium intybus]|uniref:Uncharacterized protein n=1 Tax=Cichorium intybus TaxID=13427 RepID=A0ACB9GE26_CICIN|nr:hypothetical protein L2E82_11318 [Cichorium intybus]
MSTASSLPLKTRRPPILNSPSSVSIPPSHHDDHHNTNNGSPPSPSSNTQLSLWVLDCRSVKSQSRTNRKVKLCTIFQIVTKDLTDMISLAPWKDNPYQGLMWLTRELAGQTVFSLLTVLSDLSMFFYIFEVVDHFAKGHRIQNHGHSPLLSCCFCPFNVLKFKHGFWKLWTNGKDKWKLRSCSVVTCDSF